MYGIEHLKRKLSHKRARVLTRYRYYDMKELVRDFGISTPPELRHCFNSTLGWCAKAVDSLADRLSFYQFFDDTFDMNTIFRMNSADILIPSAIKAALIGSCSFIYIAAGDDGMPRLQAIDGANATGIIETQTGLLTEGYAVLERDKDWFFGEPVKEAYFTTEGTYIYESGKLANTIPNPARYALLVPIIYRPGATRPFGHSRISRACMDYTRAAVRTIKRSEIAAEFYSFPQKYVTGLSQDHEELESWKMSMSSLLWFEQDEDGNRPSLGQFQVGSMAPHIEQIKMFAELFAGETGLTVDDLGFVAANPTSADAIKASHETLRLQARTAQKSFGAGLLNAGYLAASVRDGYAYNRQAIYATRPAWEPIFEPDASQLGMIADAVLKLNQAVPGFVDVDKVRLMTGLE